MSNIYGECARHPGNNMVNCPLCDIENFNVKDAIGKENMIKLRENAKLLDINKYYTPTIDEFHVGFEFESNYTMFSNKHDEWKSHIFTVDMGWFWEAYHNDAIDTEFRVKYLDIYDCRDLDWESSGNKEYLMYYKGDIHIQLYFDDKIRDANQGVGITIYSNVDDSTPTFNGYINNKSELKVLMKQLAI